MLGKTLWWSQHISNIAKKASNTLNFLKRNLSDCSPNVKASAYLTMVRPQMEYVSVIWDPYYNCDRDKLESIQWRAARWVLSDYSRTSSVSLMLHQLSWPTLQIRQNISRLQLFHKIFHHQISLSIPTYYLPVTRDTRHYHPYHFILPPVSTTSHLQSYFSRTIKEWNNLPTSILDTTDYDTFSNNLQLYINCAVCYFLGIYQLCWLPSTINK